MRVVVVPFALAHRNHASVRHFALHMLELNRGVIDMEAVVQTIFYVAQYALAPTEEYPQSRCGMTVRESPTQYSSSADRAHRLRLRWRGSQFQPFRASPRAACPPAGCSK